MKAGTKHEIFVLFCNVHGPADGDEEEGIMDKYVSIFLMDQGLC